MNKRIKKLRKELHLTQEEFSSKIGLSRNFIAQIETGMKIPSERTVKDICREFNINEDWLRNGTEPMTRTVDTDFESICADIGVRDPKAKEAILKYYELSDEDKELWWRYMERFMK